MERRNKNTNDTLNCATTYAEQTLRRRSEDRADDVYSKRGALPATNLEVLSPETMQKIVHQLQVHQIELEMQNEELRRTQWQLDTARLRYFDLYDLAPVGYCTLSEQGMILEANLMAARLLGWDRGTLVQQPLSRFILKADQDIYYLHRKLLLELAEPQSCELRLLNNEGTLFWALLASTYEKDTDGIPILRMVMSDISERKEAAVERALLDELLQEKNVALELATAIAVKATATAEKATVAAEKANLAKSDFLSSMSHELRTPLSAILGFAQLLDGGSPLPSPIQKRSLDHIQQAGWYLLELINEILDLALIESGKLSLSMEAVSLADVMLDCQTMIEPQAESRNISLHFSQIKTPYFVSADHTRLKQVIINLLSNAIKYNKANGSVVVSCVEQSPGRLRICVEDSGEGLSPDKISQLFQPFNRLGQETNSEEGTGIGLVMTKRLSELMNGEIGVESIVGKGSMFWIEINLTDKPQTTAKGTEPTVIADSELRADTPLRTVLYVEDNPANLMLVEDLIARRSDLRLMTATDANAGIELARRSQPDIILMDINLPGINGTQALKILAQDPKTAHIPVVAVSANAIPSDIEKGLEAGFFRYLTKPINIHLFMDTLDVVLKHAATKSR